MGWVRLVVCGCLFGPKVILSSQELFVDKQLSESGLVHITVESVESCEGEARVNNRKGKIIVFFEWNIVLTFRGW